jgi:vacuolar-type H+-ATPase subunit F/Vma7|tara:strand:- start:585 stop:881 length:297 start_codon:yes stop_codon:yes gene_type:complete
MKELGVLGGSEFTLGFRLTGIKKVIEFKDEKDANAMMADKTIGVVIMDQKSFDSLSDFKKEEVTNNNEPVFVVVSDQPQDELRNMIIRSIGVDLMQEG